jgi:hypothetical protein
MWQSCPNIRDHKAAIVRLIHVVKARATTVAIAKRRRLTMTAMATWRVCAFMSDVRWISVFDIVRKSRAHRTCKSWLFDYQHIAIHFVEQPSGCMADQHPLWQGARYGAHYQDSN